MVARPPTLAADQTPMAPVLMHLFEQLKQQDCIAEDCGSSAGNVPIAPR